MQLSFLLRGLAEGGINDNQKAQLAYQIERVPQNGLFQASYGLFTNGDMTAAYNILLDKARFPADALPNTSHRCDPYLWERDPGADWQPCEPMEVHDGTDLALVSAILLGELRGQ